MTEKVQDKPLTAEWIYKGVYKIGEGQYCEYGTCSNCGMEISHLVKICPNPNCGAQMTNAEG